MLYWSIVFLLVALITGALGTWGIEGLDTYAARFVSLLFLILFVVTMVTGWHGGRKFF